MTDAVEVIDGVEEESILPAPEEALDCPKCKKFAPPF